MPKNRDKYVIFTARLTASAAAPAARNNGQHFADR